MKLPNRIKQVMHYLPRDHGAAPAIPDDAQTLLNEPMLHQFRILSPGDQVHLLSVYRYLKVKDAPIDTLTAGLIHDVGKACMKCNITVVDRGLHVVLNTVLPGPYRLFAARKTSSDRWRGLHRLANHPQRGAWAAQQAGYNERVCWLIRHHESGGDSNDRQLQLLREADDHAGASFDRKTDA